MSAEHSKPRTMPRVRDGVRLGMFLPNQRNSNFVTTADNGGTDATWQDVKRVALLGEEVGLSFLLPVARWKGLKGDIVDVNPYGLETVTLTASILALTRRITMLTTMHTALFNPVVAAKLGATMDQISGGRWGINIVAGWNAGDFNSMGLALREHEDRYAHATHWLAAIRELWEKGVSSYTCEYFQLDKAECLPRPVQIGGPIVVNAGYSPTGMKFAIDNGDYLFGTAAKADQLRSVKDETAGDVGYIALKKVLVRPTRAEAVELAERILAGGDRRAHAQLLAHGERGLEGAVRELADPQRMRDAILGGAVIGSPADVAVELADWAVKSEVDGICLTLFDHERALELMHEQVWERLGNELADRGKSLHLER